MRTNDSHYIYGLIDPTTSQIRYIGRAKDPRKRFLEHMKDKTDCEKSVWIRTLRTFNLTPMLVILEETTEAAAPLAEKQWIATGLNCYWELTNSIITDVDTSDEARIGRSYANESAGSVPGWALIRELHHNNYSPVFINGEIIVAVRVPKECDRNGYYSDKAAIQAINIKNGKVFYRAYHGTAIPFSEIPQEALESLDVLRSHDGKVWKGYWT